MSHRVPICSLWLLVTSIMAPAQESIIISEFLASNDGGYSFYPEPNQLNGRTDDWLELQNLSGETVSLDGWFLTDDATDLTQWAFPIGTTIPANSFLVVYASGDGTPDANGNLHTNFRLSAGGEFLALVQPNQVVASSFGPDGADYPEQGTDISYGIDSVSSLPVFFAEPTPGNPNELGGLAQVEDTSFDIDRGIYSNPFSVTIMSETAGAMIYYSIDGNPPIDSSGAPTSSALLYSAPVQISQTTILRAAAVKDGMAPTNIDTQSYILVDIAGADPDGSDLGGLNTLIREQTQPAGFPDLASGDYEMDQRVTKSIEEVINLPMGTTEAQAFLQGLVDIPTLSLAMDFDDFAGPLGIYTNPESRGSAWERACSAELIQGDNSDSWQENCGVRVQGGVSRRPENSPKHSLSLRFRSIYGASKLEQKLFPDSEAEAFNSLTIRSSFTNSWLSQFASFRSRASLIRDQWARSTMLDMGNPAAGHGMMVHLYINGFYWGVHNLIERPDSSHYAEYNGGDEDLLDARNAAEFVDGDSTAWEAMRAVVSGGDWERVQQVLDVDNYIDYQIMNRYAGNRDLFPSNNWRAAGGGAFPPGQPELMAPWQIYAWDSERTLESVTTSFEPPDPTELRTLLITYPEYRIRFADRLQKHFFNGGALSPEQANSRWTEWSSLLNRAIIAESARWGDHRGELYDRDIWLIEQERLSTSLFPSRSAFVVQDYINDEIFPNISAPVFQVDDSPQHGGYIETGGTLSFAAPVETHSIYYTIDGSDPRATDGGINTSALVTFSGMPVSLPKSSLVRARVLDTEEWSPLIEAEFYLGAPPTANNLVVSEIMYNPAGEDEGGEYLVLMNTSSSDFVNLSRVRFEEGIDFVFDLDTILAPQERMIVPASQVALNANYLTTGFRIASGEFSQNLSNGGEAIGLVRPDNTELIRFSYSDELPWPLEADGFGFSLQLANPISNPDHSQPQSWIAGAPLGNRDYDNWASNYPSADLNDPQQDWDNDSVSNNAERLLGLDPTDAVSLNPYLTSLDSSGSFSYSRRDPALTGARYTVWTSNNLVDWEQDVGANQSPSATNALGVQAVEVLLSTPLDDEQLFVRIQAN